MVKNQIITYYINAIIDLFDWNKIGVVEFNNDNRNDLINKLKQHNCLEIYNKLKEKNIKENDIANIILTSIIKNKEIDSINIKESFTVDELEEFLEYKIINAKTKTQVASLGVGNVENIGSDKYIIYTKNKFETGLDVHLTQNFKKRHIVNE